MSFLTVLYLLAFAVLLGVVSFGTIRLIKRVVTVIVFALLIKSVGDFLISMVF